MMRFITSALMLLATGVSAKGAMPCPYEWQDDTGMLSLLTSGSAAVVLAELSASITAGVDATLFTAELSSPTGLSRDALTAKYFAWKQYCYENPSVATPAIGTSGYFYGIPCVLYKNQEFVAVSNGVTINQCQETGDFLAVSVDTYNGFCRRYTHAGGNATHEDSNCRAWGKCSAVISKAAFVEGSVSGMYQYQPTIDGLHAQGLFPMSSEAFFSAARLANGWVYDFCVMNPHITEFKIGVVPAQYRASLTAFDTMLGSSTTSVQCFQGAKGPVSLYGILFTKPDPTQVSPSGLLKGGSQYDWYLGAPDGCETLASTTQMAALNPIPTSTALYTADSSTNTAFHEAWANGACCSSNCTIPHLVNGATVSSIVITSD
jgi:hypothetical protein